MDSAAAQSRSAPAVQDANGWRGADIGDRERALPDLDAAIVDEDRCGGVVGVWVGDLLHLQCETQQGAAGASGGRDGGGTPPIAPDVIPCINGLRDVIVCKNVMAKGLRLNLSNQTSKPRMMSGLACFLISISSIAVWI